MPLKSGNQCRADDGRLASRAGVRAVLNDDAAVLAHTYFVEFSWLFEESRDSNYPQP
jgi:hypothetical protein